jgi:hypothetical protein
VAKKDISEWTQAFVFKKKGESPDIGLSPLTDSIF